MSTIGSLIIPGTWPSKSDLLEAVVEKSDGYLLAGPLLHHAKQGVGFHVEHLEQVPAFVEDALEATPTGMTDQDWNAVREHTQLLEIWPHGEDMSFSALWDLVQAGGGLLKAGGCAVMLLSTARIYSASAWQELIRDCQSPDKRWLILYDALVSLRADPDWYFSVGMKLFGRADVAIPRSVPQEVAIEQINQVNRMQLRPDRSLEHAKDIPSWGGGKLAKFVAVF